jgi:DNA repair protein RadC
VETNIKCNVLPATKLLDTFDRTPTLAELKVSYRRGRDRPAKRRQLPEAPYVIRGATDAVSYLRRIWNKDTIDLREELMMLCLNAANEVLGWVNITTGGLDSTTVDPRIIFGVALQTASSGIIVAHNHPSGSPTPSPHDAKVTDRLRSGGDVLGIRFLDHLIITREDYFSFAESGWKGK